MAKAAMTVAAYPTLGNYAPGTNVGGLVWQDHFEDMRVHLVNDTDYDFRDVDVSLTSDLWVAGISRIDNVCQGMQLFQEDVNGKRVPEMWLNGTNDKGKPEDIPITGAIQMSPSGTGVICDKFPHHSTISLVVALMAINRGINGGPPATLFAPKRLPNWAKVNGDYRALGKTRGVYFKDDFPQFH
jgi:hypothetical protein